MAPAKWRRDLVLLSDRLWRNRMRILLINPNTSIEITGRLAEESKHYALGDDQVIVTQVPFGVEGIESFLQEHEAVNGLFAVLEHEDLERVDGLVIACAGDPGLHVLRETYDFPVTGLMEASLTMSIPYGYKVGVISTGDEVDDFVFSRLANLYGLGDRLKVVHHLNVGVAGVSFDMIDRLEEVVNKMAKEEGIHCVILTCAAFAGMGRVLTERTGVRVMDGVGEAIGLVRTMGTLGR